MPATPAWPLDSGVRLFVETPLSDSLAFTLDGPQAHYLTHVMRLKAGTRVRVFDDISGEWQAEITGVGKRDAALQIVAHLGPREAVPDLWLGAAPIRRARYEFTVEKACELGVARFTPVLTRRAVVDKVKADRLRAHMVEAAEQCGRTALPILDAEMKLADWLGALGGRTLFFADEAGGAPARETFAAHPGPAAILIGPEGGFDDSERELVAGTPGAVPISLGPRILRAETAAIAAVSAWMAVAGDW